MAVVCLYIEILTVGVLFFQSHGILHSQESFPSMFHPRLLETSSGVVAAENWELVEFEFKYSTELTATSSLPSGVSLTPCQLIPE